MGKGGFINLVKSTRIYRILPTLMIILVSASFANRVSTELVILGVVSILIYSGLGIQNAIQDKDYLLPSYSGFAIFILLIIGLIISLFNFIIFLTAMAWILLGYFYNTLSRYVLFGDTTLLSITHFALPLFSSSILVGFNMKFSLILAGTFFVIFFFIMPMKNLKDSLDDKIRKYKTLPTSGRKGKSITLILFSISIIPMACAYFLFNLSLIYIAFMILIILLGMFIIKKSLSKKEKSAVNLTRLFMLLFLFGFIVSKTSNFRIILLASGLGIFYLLFLAGSKFVGRKKRGKKDKKQY